jgi:GLPGLI family protein
MKNYIYNLVILLAPVLLGSSSLAPKPVQDFQGKAYYFSKSKLELGNWGARMSEAQKKQIAERLKNRLEKEYVLTFNKEESIFYEESKLDAISGATDSWGKNFTPGKQYKNVKTNTQLQKQDFYGKTFLVMDQLQPITWEFGTESKNIGKYMCLKATASIPTAQLNWYSFSWDSLRNSESTSGDSDDNEQVPMTEIEAWYSPEIPVSHGPLEYWGLPGLILEVSADNTTMLCYKIVLNIDEKIPIEAPSRGTKVAKMEYKSIIMKKMKEFRDNRGRRRG